jgi:hypothetical protein
MDDFEDEDIEDEVKERLQRDPVWFRRVIKRVVKHAGKAAIQYALKHLGKK